MPSVIAILAALLCGSIPFGLLLTRWGARVDLREIGSGNIGATNALRAGGVWLGLGTLALDTAKGVAGTSLASWVVGGWPEGWLAALLLFAPVLAHCFTPWLRFRGGKGVATAAGVLAWADPRLLIGAVVAFAALAIPTRYVSLGSLGCVVATALGAPLLHGVSGMSVGIWLIGAVVLVRHRDNIGRLMRGTEHRFGQRADTASSRA